MIRFFALLLTVLVIFGGCAHSPKTEYVVKKPSWILNPNQNGKVGAIGIAGKTYDQKESTRRQIAIGRALDELTMQKGVKVVLKIDKKDVVSNDKASVKMKTQSHFEANSSITAHIEDAWENPLTGELYIWMVLD